MQRWAVRKRGLFQLAWASALFVVLAGFAYWLDSRGWHHFPWEFAIPAGFALAGLLQGVTGVPFARLASQWDALRPWQRGVLGTAIALAISGVLFGGAVLYIVYRTAH